MNNAHSCPGRKTEEEKRLTKLLTLKREKQKEMNDRQREMQQEMNDRQKEIEELEAALTELRRRC